MPLRDQRRELTDKEKTLLLLGNNIVKARIDKNWRQEELASRLNVSVKTISAWETGRNEPGSYTLLRLAAVLEKPIAYFFEHPTFTSDVGALERESGIPPGTTKKVIRAKRKAA